MVRRARAHTHTHAHTHTLPLPPQLARSFTMVYTWAAVVGLLSFLRTFTFLSISKRMNTIWLTLYLAVQDLAVFLVGFFVVICGFAFSAHFIFGHRLREFHTVLTSFSTLNRYILGDFDYRRLAL